MKYPIVKKVYGRGGVEVGQETTWEDEPWTVCWAAQKVFANGAEQPCYEIGDFTKTLGLCPKHYGEIVGE